MLCDDIYWFQTYFQSSDITLVYNDRAVLENFHISAAFKVMREEESNILVNLSKEEYRYTKNNTYDLLCLFDDQIP
jgi:hypothetical protein